MGGAWKLVAGAAVIGVIAWAVRTWLWTDERRNDDVLGAATKANLLIAVTERGELESTKTIDVRCDVEGRENKIVWIVPEGRRVTKGEKVPHIRHRAHQQGKGGPGSQSQTGGR